MSLLTSTASHLEAMTNRATFELLATSILRKANPLYAPIIRTGVNAQGETVVAPLDGIHLIPGSSPAHYVFLQHTTTDRPKLRGKWLTAKDADLPKAIEEAVKVRAEIPEARFTVVLCTNQRADVDLVRDVSVRGASVQALEGLGPERRRPSSRSSRTRPKTPSCSSEAMRLTSWPSSLRGTSNS